MDPPSTIDYKDQALAIEDLRRRADQEPPSSIGYKDQALSIGELRQRAEQQQPPSSIDYKDQALSIEDLRQRGGAPLPEQAQVLSVHGEPVHAVPVQVLHSVQVASPQPADPSSTVSSSPTPNEKFPPPSPRRCKKTTYLWIAVLVLSVVAAVAITVAITSSSSSSSSSSTSPDSGNGGDITSAPSSTPVGGGDDVTSQPTMAPTSQPTSDPHPTKTSPPGDCSYCPWEPIEPLPACETWSMPASCADLLTTATKYGLSAQGVDLRCYTGGALEWIGCWATDSTTCDPSKFFCTSNTTSLTFGTTSDLALRAMVDPGDCCSVDSDPGEAWACSSESHPNQLSNAPIEPSDAVALCQALGYNQGSVVAVNANSCPKAKHNGDDASDWSIDYAASSGFGQSFECTM